MASTDKEIQTLQHRVMELEQQLEEAQATILVLTSPKQDGRQADKRYEHERLLHEFEQKWEAERANFLANEERLQSALLLAPHPLMIRREDGRVIMLNIAWTEITGYTLEDVPTIEAWTQKAYAEPVPRRQSLIRNEEFSQEGMQRWGEFEVTTRSGEKRIWDLRSAPLGVDSKGRRLAMTMAVDITEHKEIEKQLQENEQKYALLFGKSAIPAALLKLPDFVIVDVNEVLERLVGYTKEEMYGKAALELNIGRPEEVVQAMARFEQQGALDDNEVRIFTKSGEERVIVFNLNPLEFGGQHYAICTMQDITERKRAEKALEESKHRLNDILESLDDGLLVLNREWSLIYMNQHALQIAGHPAEELIGENIWELWPEIIGTPLESFYRQAMEKGIPGQLRIQGMRSGRWYDVNVYPSSEGITIFYVDKTEQILAEERFNKAFHASPNALVISRQQDGRIETINDTFVRFFGFSREAVIGKTSTELGMFVNPADRQEAVRRLQRDGAVRDFELDVRLKSGEVRSVSLSVELMSIGGENRMLTMIQDVTLRKQAEQARRESEERFSKAFHKAPFGMSITRWQDGTLLDVNDAWLRLTGWTRQEVLGKTTADIAYYAHPEDRELVRNRSMNDETLNDLALHITRKDGARMIITLTTTIIELQGEKCILFVINNITARKQAEEALRKSEQRLNRAQEIAHLGSWELDLINNQLTWSDEVYRIFGLQPQEFGATYEAFLEAVHPEDRSAVDSAYSGSIREGRDTYEIEHRVIKRSSGEVRIVHEKCEHFRDPGGRIIRSMGMVHDVTEQKQAEEALRASEARYRGLVESQLDLIVRVDPEGRFTFVNDAYCQKFGLKREEILGRESYKPLVHPEDLPHTLEAMKSLYQPPYRIVVEQRAFTVEGVRWIEWQDSAIRDETGKVLEIQAIGRDITARKQAGEQLKVYADRLEHSNRELEQFAFMASHDLQEPLRKIEVFSDMLLERSMTFNGRERNYLERMQNAAGRMRNMVEGLLQLSRVTTQAKPFVRVDLSSITTEVLHDLEEQIERVRARVAVEPLPVIEGDPLQLRQLMQNLIGNALKYHQPDVPPEVKIHANQLSGKIQILVEDHGIGFEQGDAERIFQPFLRLVGRSQYEGSGMGLAICRRIVERHGGEITAFSKPGQGAMFTVTLPVHHPESAGNAVRKDRHDEEPGTPAGR